MFKTTIKTFNNLSETHSLHCLRTRHGRQECRFGYPKPLQPETTIITDPEPTLLTARNDGMVNSFNPVQLSAWRANVDMQYRYFPIPFAAKRCHHFTAGTAVLGTRLLCAHMQNLAPTLHVSVLPLTLTRRAL